MTQEQPSNIALVATKLHTLLFLLLLAAIALPGAISHRLAPWMGAPLTYNGRLRLYALMFAIPWLLFWCARTGVARRGIAVRRMMDDVSWNAPRLACSAAIGIAAGILWMMIGLAIGMILRPNPDELRILQSLLPRSTLEKVYWVGICLASSSCEEFVYRGYLLKQFRALTGNLAAAIFLQAAVFGLNHAVLPWKLVITVSLLALYLGGLAAWRKSLIPGMLVHAGIKIFGGLFSST